MGKRISGRPSKRRVNNIEDGLKYMNVRDWRSLSGEGTQWKKIGEQAKIHTGLCR